MNNEYLGAYQDHILFQWFLNLRSNKKIQFFMDIGSELDKTVFWSMFATCHAVQMKRNQFTPQINVVGHQESPEDISAEDKEVELVTSSNGLNEIEPERIPAVFSEINRVLAKNGNFLFSMLIGNPTHDNVREGTFNIQTVYSNLEKAGFTVENDVLITPWPYLLTKEIIYPNTANEQTIDVLREVRDFGNISDDDGNEYTFFAPDSNVVDTFSKNEFASLIVLARKERDILQDSDLEKMTKKQLVEAITAATGEKVSSRKKKDELLEMLRETVSS